MTQSPEPPVTPGYYDQRAPDYPPPSLQPPHAGHAKRRRIWPWVLVGVILAACLGGGGLLLMAGAFTSAVQQSESGRMEDVKITSCERTVIDSAEVRYEVKNSSPNARDYFLEFELVDKNGTRLGTANGIEQGVEPGVTAKGTAVGMLTGNEPFSCRLVSA